MYVVSIFKNYCYIVLLLMDTTIPFPNSPDFEPHLSQTYSYILHTLILSYPKNPYWWDCFLDPELSNIYVFKIDERDH